STECNRVATDGVWNRGLITDREHAGAGAGVEGPLDDERPRVSGRGDHLVVEQRHWTEVGRADAPGGEIDERVALNRRGLTTAIRAVGRDLPEGIDSGGVLVGSTTVDIDPT